MRIPYNAFYRNFNDKKEEETMQELCHCPALYSLRRSILKHPEFINSTGLAKQGLYTNHKTIDMTDT